MNLVVRETMTLDDKFKNILKYQSSEQKFSNHPFFTALKYGVFLMVICKI